MSLAKAIEQLEAEIESLGLYAAVASARPALGSTEWYLGRAKGLGLSSLRQMKQLEVGEDHPAADRVYKAMAKAAKGVEAQPPAEEPSLILSAGE